ncbi:hypothetical protein RDABS01_038609 [Bienertia sinuspersici]
MKKARLLLDEMTTFATDVSFDDRQFVIDSLLGKVASCDGLTLFKDEKSLLLLVNPTTKEFKELPKWCCGLDLRATSFIIYGVGAVNSPFNHAAARVTSQEKFLQVPPPSLVEEYGVKESWTKFTILNTEMSVFRPLCLLKKDQVVLVENEETAEEKLVLYNLKGAVCI